MDGPYHDCHRASKQARIVWLDATYRTRRPEADEARIPLPGPRSFDPPRVERTENCPSPLVHFCCLPCPTIAGNCLLCSLQCRTGSEIPRDPSLWMIVCWKHEQPKQNTAFVTRFLWIFRYVFQFTDMLLCTKIGGLLVCHLGGSTNYRQDVTKKNTWNNEAPLQKELDHLHCLLCPGHQVAWKRKCGRSSCI